MAKYNIRNEDPLKYDAVREEQAKLRYACDGQLKMAKVCPYCGHTISYVCKGSHAYTQEKCPKCGEVVIFPPISFRKNR